jgi:hypothetical protein
MMLADFSSPSSKQTASLEVKDICKLYLQMHQCVLWFSTRRITQKVDYLIEQIVFTIPKIFESGFYHAQLKKEC